MLTERPRFTFVLTPGVGYIRVSKYHSSVKSTQEMMVLLESLVSTHPLRKDACATIFSERVCPDAECGISFCSNVYLYDALTGVLVTKKREMRYSTN